MRRRDAAEKKARLAPKTRTDEERELIRQAKGVLMDRNNMTEDEAHKYMQKCSMDSGTGTCRDGPYDNMSVQGIVERIGGVDGIYQDAWNRQ